MFNCCPNWIEIPQKPHFCTAVVHSHINFCCDSPMSKVTQKWDCRKSSSRPRAFQEMDQPYFILLLIKTLQPHDANYWASTKKKVRSWDAANFIWERYFALTCLIPDQIFGPDYPLQCFLPHHMLPLVWLPTCQQGCSKSQTKELPLISIASQ